MSHNIDLLSWKKNLYKNRLGLPLSDSAPSDSDPDKPSAWDFSSGSKQSHFSQNRLPDKPINLKVAHMPVDKKVVYQDVLQKIKDHNDEQEEKPKPWTAPVFHSTKEFEEQRPQIIASLTANDPMVLYTSKKAKQNFIDMIDNVGKLYEKYFALNSK